MPTPLSTASVSGAASVGASTPGAPSSPSSPSGPHSLDIRDRPSSPGTPATRDGLDTGRWPGRTAVVLLNLGTPAAPTARAVRPYLREFLIDGRVIDIPWFPRWLLVNLVIAPFRGPASAAKYRSIWTPRGSPLLVHSEDLREGLERVLRRAEVPTSQNVAAPASGPSQAPVEVLLAMRYGSPSIAAAVERLDALRATRVVLVPLFPQYSSAAWGSAAQAFMEALGRLTVVPAVTVVPPFFDHRGFLDASAELLRDALARQPVDHVVFSYHGLPHRQAKAACRGGECTVDGPGACCEAPRPENAGCYRAQCTATSKRLAARANVTTFSTVYQSRLGRAAWLGPPLDATLEALARAGSRRVAVACPSFVADCLETLEEVGLASKDVFLRSGGESFALVPCLNADPRWIDGLAGLVTERLS